MTTLKTETETEMWGDVTIEWWGEIRRNKLVLNIIKIQCEEGEGGGAILSSSINDNDNGDNNSGTTAVQHKHKQ